MSRRIIYMINPVSGTKNKSALLNIIKCEHSKQNIDYEILHTNAEKDYAYLLKKIAAEKITDVVVCGGDGTVNQIANALIGVDVNVGIIPMGSGNGLALAAQIPKDIHKALAIIFAGRSEYIDGFYINDSFSCMLCGLGFDAQVAHDFAQQSKRGLWTYVKQTMINLFRAKPYLFSLKSEGHSFDTDAFFISIANSNQFGNQFTIAPKASLTDGLLDIVVVKKMNKVKMLFMILKHIFSGEIRELNEISIRAKGILYFQTNLLTITNPAMAPMHIDGEPVATSKELSIRVLEKAFKLLQP